MMKRFLSKIHFVRVPQGRGALGRFLPRVFVPRWLLICPTIGARHSHGLEGQSRQTPPRRFVGGRWPSGSGAIQDEGVRLGYELFVLRPAAAVDTWRAPLPGDNLAGWVMLCGWWCWTKNRINERRRVGQRHENRSNKRGNKFLTRTFDARFFL